MKPVYRRALIVGAGDGLSASVARLFAKSGLKIGVAARNTDKLKALAAETGAAVHACDATRSDQVEALFAAMDGALGGSPDVVVYNASGRTRGPLIELEPAAVANTIAVSAYGGFLVAQAFAKRALPNRHGAILFTGASASVKGYPNSAPFAMGKFALRGLAQSLARELQPQGIHVAHFVIDGGIRNPGRTEPADAPDSLLDPDAIAESYLHVLQQDRSAWSWEIELRPWVERF
ncbi:MULTISPECIES: SDR family NAD(P)-dependent oxidoreductase [Rhodomicrobium]|uniref:SDR family NAD(P)-dependent oxidoreductase n=1 Tax=Rhodomicrobium TaxID=1068 RepID=UPI000B4BFF19|nr:MULTISPECIES: SDR family NAD(P)-dependent oxidoreductase [Rhodomicrobium]